MQTHEADFKYRQASVLSICDSLIELVHDILGTYDLVDLAAQHALTVS